MQMVEAMTGHIGNLGFYTLAFLAVLSLVVFVHEYGHFIVGRWCGVKVTTFSLGFGREIVGFTDRKGTRWKIGWLPLGGYVNFLGDANAASLPSDGPAARAPDSFPAQPVAKRAAIVVAGPLANFLLAFVIFTASFMIVGTPTTPPRIDSLVPGGAAEQAGFEPGDVITEVNGVKIMSFSDIQRQVMPYAGERITIIAERNGSPFVADLVPVRTEVDDGSGGKVGVGIIGIRQDSAGGVTFERKGLWEASKLGVYEVGSIISGTFHFLYRIGSGHESADQLGGPIAIAKLSGTAASFGIGSLIRVAALISVSIGLLNLFPIPVLDGGHLVFYAIEAIRGRPLGRAAQEAGFGIGLAMMMALMLFATWNDLVRLTGL